MFNDIFARLSPDTRKILVLQSIQADRQRFNPHYAKNTSRSFPGYRHINAVPSGQLIQRVLIDAVESNELAQLLIRVWFEKNDSLARAVRNSLEAGGYDVTDPNFDSRPLAWRPLKSEDLRVSEDKTYYSPRGKDLDGFDPVLVTLVALLFGWFDDSSPRPKGENEKVVGLDGSGGGNNA